MNAIASDAGTNTATLALNQSTDPVASRSGGEVDQKHDVDHSPPVHRRSAHTVEPGQQGDKSTASTITELYKYHMWWSSAARVLCMTAVGAGCLLLAKGAHNWPAVAWWTLFFLFDTKEYVSSRACILSHNLCLHCRIIGLQVSGSSNSIAIVLCVDQYVDQPGLSSRHTMLCALSNAIVFGVPGFASRQSRRHAGDVECCAICL